MLRKFWLIGLALILTACQAGAWLQSGPTPTPFPDTFSTLADVGANKLFITCEGQGEPTIILENGLGITSWDKNALARFKRISRTCTYLRAGVMSELSQDGGPRTAMDQVKDLHDLLAQTGVPGPYILVGHLTAGFNIILYTDQYPEDVVGLVCVDCYPAGIRQNFYNKLDALAPNDTDAIRMARESIDREYGWENWNEHLDVLASEQQVTSVTSLGDRPFIFMVATGAAHLVSIYGIGEGTLPQLFEESWMESIQRLSQLSTRSRIEEIPLVDMESIKDSDKVDQYIQEVVTAAKSSK